MVEAYRNEKELFNLQCWALTANAFFLKRNGNGFIMNMDIQVIMSLFIFN